MKTKKINAALDIEADILQIIYALHKLKKKTTFKIPYRSEKS